MRANQVCVWLTAVFDSVSATVFFPKNYLAKWGKPLQMPQLPCSVKTKTLFLRGINIRQI